MNTSADKPEIVVASSADAAILSELSTRTYIAAFGADMTPEDLGAHVERVLSVDAWRAFLERDVALAASVGDQWIGFIQYGPTDRATVMEIRRVYVDPEWQGRGIGSTLIETALQSADLSTASAVEIDVWEANANARRLYERFGFIATDRRVAFRNGRGEVSGYDVVLERWRGA